MRYKSVEEFLEVVAERNPCQPEYLQAVAEVIESLWPFISKNPHYGVVILLFDTTITACLLLLDVILRQIVALH